MIPTLSPRNSSNKKVSSIPHIIRLSLFTLLIFAFFVHNFPKKDQFNTFLPVLAAVSLIELWHKFIAGMNKHTITPSPLKSKCKDYCIQKKGIESFIYKAVSSVLIGLFLLIHNIKNKDKVNIYLSIGLLIVSIYATVDGVMTYEKVMKQIKDKKKIKNHN